MQISNGKNIRCFAPVIKKDKYSFDHTLTSVEMLFTVKKIEHSAFCGCSKLKEITLSKNLKEIGDTAFLNCTSLEEITVPASVKILGEGVFRDCKNLKTVRLPDGLKILPKSAFKNCVSLEKIVLPRGLEEIDEEAFSGCVNLKEIVFPDGLKIIEKKAFKRCFNLKAAIFPESLSHIGDKAFEHCKALTSLVFNGALDHIGAAVFPQTPCVIPRLTGTMFSSSFMQKEDYPLCPTVTVPDGTKSLALGFEDTLDYKRRNAGKTCYAHILALEKYGAKLFISEHYYSYDDRTDLLVKNGEFDFKKYDEQINRAAEREKPVIALFRLTYPKGLSNTAKSRYIKILNENTAEAALFTVEKNEPDALKYIVENCRLTTEFCTTLYETAAKNRFSKLQQILSHKKEKTGFEEIEAFFDEIG